MKAYKKYKPYVRKLNGREIATDFRNAVRLNFYKKCKKAYVMVRHGFHNIAMEVSKTKKEIKDKAIAGTGARNFNEWANVILSKDKYCQTGLRIHMRDNSLRQGCQQSQG